MHKKFGGKDTVILGISPDPPAKQAKFKQKHELPYTLLCDVEHKVAEAYGVWKLKTFMGSKFMGVEREHVPHRQEGQDRPGLREGKGRGARRRSLLHAIARAEFTALLPSRALV